MSRRPEFNKHLMEGQDERDKEARAILARIDSSSDEDKGRIWSMKVETTSFYRDMCIKSHYVKIYTTPKQLIWLQEIEQEVLHGKDRRDQNNTADEARPSCQGRQQSTKKPGTQSTRGHTTEPSTHTSHTATRSKPSGRRRVRAGNNGNGKTTTRRSLVPVRGEQAGD